MSHKPGAYLGGIRTVDDLRLRSVVDEDTGCWHWRLSVSQGSPRVNFLTPDTGEIVKMRGRRAALYLARGHDVRTGSLAFARLQCLSDDCVNPAHSRTGTRAQHGEWLRLSGKHKGLPSKSVASRKRWAGKTKITPAMAAEIKVSCESTYALAKRYGLSQYAVWSCRTGKSHRTDIRGASVFTWGAAA